MPWKKGDRIWLTGSGWGSDTGHHDVLVDYSFRHNFWWTERGYVVQPHQLNDRTEWEVQNEVQK